MQSTHTIFPSLTKHAFLAQERERISKRVTITVMSANVLRWLGRLSTIPNEMLEAGRAVLCRAQHDGALRDYRLYALGSVLVIQMITLGQGLHNSKVCELASDMVTAVQGRLVLDGEKLQATRHEPFALVSIEALGASAVEDPVAIVRLQGGLPALGEAHLNLGADFHFTIGGPGDGYHVGVMPVTDGADAAV